jgi:hypothetical protein
MDIAAPPEEVWAVLMDFPSYANWNPMVLGISGEKAVGAGLVVKIAMKGRRVMTFRPKVVEYEAGRRFGWLGKLAVRGLFDGLHRFEVQANDSGTTFIHGEEFRGLLPPVLGRVLGDTHELMIAMNEALAREVQRRAAAVAA